MDWPDRRPDLTRAAVTGGLAEAKSQTVHGLLRRRFLIENPHSSRAYNGGNQRADPLTWYKRGEAGERISHTITAEELKFGGNEHTPEVRYGTFFGHWSDPSTGGYAVTLFQAQQNFPKELAAEEASVTAGIIPEGTGLVMAQGMAKTHRLFIHLHGPDEDPEEINRRSLQFQLPDRPTLDEESYERAGVLEPLTVETRRPGVERTLVYLADYRARAYGSLHWGDAPDLAYSQQARPHRQDEPDRSRSAVLRL